MARAASFGNGGRQTTPEAPFKLQFPALNGIRMASPLVISIDGALSNLIEPLPSSDRKMLKPARTSLFLPVK